jgi:hypothetical protein
MYDGRFAGLHCFDLDPLDRLALRSERDGPAVPRNAGDGRTPRKRKERVNLTHLPLKVDVRPFVHLDWWTIPPDRTTLEHVRVAGQRSASRNIGDALRFGLQVCYQKAVNAEQAEGTSMSLGHLYKAMGIPKTLGQRWARLWERYVEDPDFRASIPTLTLMQAYEAAGLRVRGGDKPVKDITGDGEQPDVRVPHFDAGDPVDPREEVREASATLAKVAITSQGDATLDVLALMLRNAVAVGGNLAEWDRKWGAQRAVKRRLERILRDVTERRDWVRYLWVVIDEVNAAGPIIADGTPALESDPDGPENTANIEGITEGFHTGDLAGRWTAAPDVPDVDDNLADAHARVVAEVAPPQDPTAAPTGADWDAVDAAARGLERVEALDEFDRSVLADRYVDLAVDAAVTFGTGKAIITRLEALEPRHRQFFLVIASTRAVVPSEFTLENLGDPSFTEKHTTKCVLEARNREAAIATVREAARGRDPDLNDPDLDVFARPLTEHLSMSGQKSTVKVYLRRPRKKREATLKEYLKSLGT